MTYRRLLRADFVELLGAAIKERRDFTRLNSRRGRFSRRGAYRSFLHVLGRSQHFLGAICEPVYLACLAGTALVFIERRVNPAQHGFERDSRILPGFYQRPVESREQQSGPAAALKMLFDFREVIEVV